MTRTQSSPAEIRLKRIYEDAEEADGFRVLVDRLWPRGKSKKDAALDAWLKEVAPSPELRRWWDHDPDRMDEFAARYRHELDESEGAATLRSILAEHATVTLLYAARDEKVNHAVVLRQYLIGC